MSFGFVVLFCALVASAVVVAGSTGVGRTELLAVDQLRADYLAMERALWRYLNTNIETHVSDEVIMERRLQKVYNAHRIFILSDKNALIAGKFEPSRYAATIKHYEWSLMERDLLHINGNFDFYKNVIMLPEDSIVASVSSLGERALLDFTDTILQRDGEFALRTLLDRLTLIMVNQTLYYRAMMSAYERKCELQSVQQFVLALYTDIAVAELKGYAMVQFSWMMLRAYKRGNFTEESNLMRADFKRRTARTTRLLREVMRRSDRTIWRCDPPKQRPGVTYDEVTRLLQGYIENEVDMSIDESCREDCPTYTLARSNGCFKGFCRRQKRCSGKIHDCEFVDSDMWVCPASSNSTRRYEYIQYESGTVLGKKGPCPRGATQVESWRRWLVWRCSYCFCLCDEQGPKSDRYFNLREMNSNVDKNRVITGLRFVKKNRIFHIQIQEGALLPRGGINASTLAWQPVANYKIYDSEVRNGKDYHTLSYESRSIDLDDIHTDDQTFIVTGVRFRVLGVHLNLEVRFSEFDFVSGKLIEPLINSFWKSNDNTDVSGIKREKIKLIQPDIPSRSMTKSSVTSKDNQYIEFVNSNMYSDAAQTTVPFIDTQDVVSHTAVPLSGAGVYHKGGVGSGGFIAPKIITYNFAPHVQQIDID